MTDPSHYAGTRYTGPEQGQTVYPPKDTSWMADASCVGMDAEPLFGTPNAWGSRSAVKLEGPGESPNRPRSKSEPQHKERT